MFQIFRFDTVFNKEVSRSILREVQNDVPNVKEDEVYGMEGLRCM